MTSAITIAIVEDHKALREIFAEHLQNEEFNVFECSCAEELDEYYVDNKADILILDVNLPGESGTSIAKRYRNAYPAIHIIMLTVRADVKDKILGYESGADIYLPKPVSADELSAAINAIRRRIISLKGGDGFPQLDVVKRTITNQLLKIDLSQTELSMIKGLIEAPDHSLEYWQLLELIGKEVNETNKASLTVYIHRLNNKLEELGIPDPAIKSLWKVGYQLTTDIVIL
jgi:two-component system phosphate regulon response regulator OmpR